MTKRVHIVLEEQTEVYEITYPSFSLENMKLSKVLESRKMVEELNGDGSFDNVASLEIANLVAKIHKDKNSKGEQKSFKEVVKERSGSMKIKTA